MLKVGDKVAYSASFCKSIFAQTGDIPRMRGEVIDIETFGPRGKYLVTVRWNGGDTTKALSGNLAKVGANTRFCAC